MGGRVLGSNEVAFLTRSAGRAPLTFFNERPATPGVRIGMATAQYRFGGFGVVYKGHDAELHRDVAIKVPHRLRVAEPEDGEAYLAEARVLAGLDHPGIVPVYDVGCTEDGCCYLVSKLVAGSDLRARCQQRRFSMGKVSPSAKPSWSPQQLHAADPRQQHRKRG